MLEKRRRPEDEFISLRDKFLKDLDRRLKQNEIQMDEYFKRIQKEVKKRKF